MGKRQKIRVSDVAKSKPWVVALLPSQQEVSKLEKKKATCKSNFPKNYSKYHK